ncbi:hypothetical protein ARSEF4850_001581 [Beauveria asiatica]
MKQDPDIVRAVLDSTRQLAKFCKDVRVALYKPGHDRILDCNATAWRMLLDIIRCMQDLTEFSIEGDAPCLTGGGLRRLVCVGNEASTELFKLCDMSALERLRRTANPVEFSGIGLLLATTSLI